MMSGRRSPGLLVRLIGQLRHVPAFRHVLRGRHFDAARQHRGLAQDARGDRMPADVRPSVHLLRLVIRSGHLGGQVPFGVHGLQVARVVFAFPGALYEQPASAGAGAARPDGRRRRRHLLGSFGKSVHDDGHGRREDVVDFRLFVIASLVSLFVFLIRQKRSRA